MKTPFITSRIAALVCAVCVLGAWGVSFAQSQTAIPPLRSEKVKSMGQPVYWKPYIEPSLLWDRQNDSNAGFQLVGGLSYDWLGKAIGAAVKVIGTDVPSTKGIL